VIGRDNILALINGRARMRRARIEAAPFAMAMWELSVTEVKDQSWGRSWCRRPPTHGRSPGGDAARDRTRGHRRAAGLAGLNTIPETSLEVTPHLG
jgi:hypothetical protein